MAHQVRFGLTHSKRRPPTCVPDVEGGKSSGVEGKSLQTESIVTECGYRLPVSVL